MTRGTLPPQAYTREQLSQAFVWLQNQPENVRKMAETSDALVALYLKAKRNGDGDVLAAPASEKAFRENLKSLAVEMQQFNAPAQTPNMAAPAPAAPTTPSVDPTRTKFDFADIESISFDSVTPPINQSEVWPAQNRDTGAFASLDQRTRNLLIRVQNRFNLSSEMEALRMLVVLGYEKAQSLFSKDF